MIERMFISEGLSALNLSNALGDCSNINMHV